MKHIERILLLCTALLMMVSCIDEQNTYSLNPEDETRLSFSVSSVEQDWYGASNETRSTQQNNDEVIPTDMITEDGHCVYISGHEVYGIDSKQRKMGADIETRAYVSQSIDLRKLSISQFGFTQGDGNNTFVELMNMPAVTTDGHEWSCNEFFVNRKDYTALRVFGALFPYSEDYVVKNDDYEDKKYMFGSLQSFYQLRCEYELVSDRAEEQEDLLYAKQARTFSADTYATGGPTPLSFHHAMTAVKVKLGPSGFVPCVIKSVRLMNVHNKGTFHFFDRWIGSEDTQDKMLARKGWWDVDESTTNCYAETDFDTQGEYNCYVTGDAATFMMIPQELPQNATLELDIVFTGDIDQKVVTIKAPIGQYSEGSRPKYWNIGTTYEYTISTNENVDGYYMVVDGVDRKERVKYVDAEGGDASILLKSYKRNDDGTQPGQYSNLPWQYVGWSDDGVNWYDDDLDWLHMSLSDGTELYSGTLGEGSVSGELINIKIDEMQEETGLSHADILRSRPAKGRITDGAYDLSRHEWGTGAAIGTTTANCYVIDAPGHYTFPTIYGNSMKNGKANPMAYGNSSSSFVDYKDNRIISPLIQYNTRLSRAALVWEDVNGMVKDVKLTQRGDYVEFTIDRDHIDQGNAVIAVYDDQNLLVWSWHIWVTDEDISATVPTGTGDYRAMPVNLGWKSSSKARAVRGRDIYLLFAQGEDDEDMMNYQTEIRISQKSNYISDEKQNHQGSSPYYQWGRKDPFVGACNSNGVSKSLPVYTHGAHSFYAESLTVWKLDEGWDIANKVVGFVVAGAVGAAVSIATCGIATVLVAGALVTATEGVLYVAATEVEQRCFSETVQWGTTIGYSIQHPTCDIKSAMTWTDCKAHAPYHDLWGIGQDTDNQNKKVVKTIYDPCPVGFHVPEGNAFSAISKFDNGLSGNGIFLPACGGRIDYIHGQSMEGNFDIPLLDVGKACGYWTAAPAKENKKGDNHDNEWYRESEGAFALVGPYEDEDKKTTVGIIKGAYEAWGYNIRPIADY